jgi:hypothetical protein
MRTLDSVSFETSIQSLEGVQRISMGFLNLPAELRNVIYELVLVENGTIEIRRRHVFEID